MKRDIEQYNSFSAADYYDAVFVADDTSVEAVCNLLQKRLNHALQRVFELHGFGLNDEFNDTIDDFFLYLYEGNHDDRPFAMVLGIQNKQAFFGWVVSTYRNFLLNRAKEEMKRKALQEEARHFTGDDGGSLNEETMIGYLASAIAFADQRFVPSNLFLFYRSVLSLLDHSRAIPQEEMALAMKIHPVTYRVRTKRQRDSFQEFILRQESGHHLELDRRHELMRLCIVEEFNRLYDLLIGFYNRVLEQLPDKGDIQALRQRYRQERGISMHEDSCYGYRYTGSIRLLYNALKS